MHVVVNESSYSQKVVLILFHDAAVRRVIGLLTNEVKLYCSLIVGDRVVTGARSTWLGQNQRLGAEKRARRLIVLVRTSLFMPLKNALRPRSTCLSSFSERCCKSRKVPGVRKRLSIR